MTYSVYFITEACGPIKVENGTVTYSVYEHVHLIL